MSRFDVGDPARLEDVELLLVGVSLLLMEAARVAADDTYKKACLVVGSRMHERSKELSKGRGS